MNGLESIVTHRHEDDKFLFETYGYSRRAKDLIKGTAILWISGTTFRNACDLMVLYVTGLLPTSPSHAGPILSETSNISNYIAQCNRNGMLTVTSEPAQVGYQAHTMKKYTVENASIEIFIREHNYDLLMNSLAEYGERFEVQYPEDKLSDELGKSYIVADEDVRRLFIIDTMVGTNEMYEMLANISREFRDYPLYE